VGGGSGWKGRKRRGSRVVNRECKILAYFDRFGFFQECSEGNNFLVKKSFIFCFIESPIG
jgi:hypothetical protein